MKNERFDTVEDLIHSDLFCEWVQHQKHKIFWQKWQANNAERQALIEEARTFINQLSFNKDTISKIEVDEAMTSLWSNIKMQQPIVRPIKDKTQKLSMLLGQRWRIAASVLFLLAVSWLTWQYTITDVVTYATTYGETKTLTLPDGSLVVLQANSVLKVPKNWTKESERTVSLEGEAFFKVTKMKASSPIKFTVHTNEFKVEVLGTQFNVLNRQNHKRVVLQEGKVQMQLANNKIIHLKPNEMIIYAAQTKSYEKSVIKATNHTAWTANKLILDETPLSEIARMLVDNYGYQVNFSENINQAKTRTTIGAIDIENIDDLIAKTAASYEVEISKQGQQINIK